MPYIGTDINYGNLAKQTGTGDGADTTPIAALTYTVPSSESILVFLDGVCQVPATDFTATGTTLTFTTAPANGVAILVMFLGRSLDIGTPADSTITLAKMTANSVDSDQYVDGSIDTIHIANNQVDETKLKDALIGDFSDVTVTAADTFLYGDATDSGNTKKDTVQGILDLVPAGGITHASEWRLTTAVQFTSGGPGNVISANLEQSDSAASGILGAAMTESSGVFTFPATGIWSVTLMVYFQQTAGASNYSVVNIDACTDGASFSTHGIVIMHGDASDYQYASHTAIIDIVSTSTHKVRFRQYAQNANCQVGGSTNDSYTTFNFIRLGDT